MATVFRSNAMSSQGTAVYVGQLTGGVAKPITALTKANPAVVTSVAHGMLSGDVGKFASVGGMIQLNGTDGIVSEPVTDTFELFGVDSTAFTTYTTGGTFTPYPMLKACEARDFSIAGGQAAEIDVTTMCSTAVETRIGLQDYGEATMNVNFVPGDPALLELQAAAADAQARWFKVVLPQGSGVMVFQAFVRQISMSFGVNQAIQGSVGLRLSGPIEFIDVVPPDEVLLNAGIPAEEIALSQAA